MNKRLKFWLLAIAGGILPAVAWPPNSFPLLLFFAFVPFFLLETHFEEKGRRKYFHLYTYFGLFLFNLITTWWVWNASPGGAVFMLFANTFLMTLPFRAYRFSKRLVGRNKALFTFVIAWLTFEYFHFRWDLNYPWLTLGNAFATAPNLVQWYEYTGALGGSLWILVANVLVFRITQQRSLITSSTVALWLVLPLWWSTYLKNTQAPSDWNTEIVIVQPNIDPYNKFEAETLNDQLKKFIRLAEESVTDQTQVVIYPETALARTIYEKYLEQSYEIRVLQQFIKKHELDGILIGAATRRFFEEGEELPPYPRYHEPTGRFFDAYNTALALTWEDSIHVYHKSKLVPGVESLPFPYVFNKLDALLKLDFGGESGNLGKDSAASPFTFGDAHVGCRNVFPTIAPTICYESVYGEYVGDFVNKGADVIAVITNDGWWGNTPGHKQHMHYARLRAIEYRRYVVRSANTGISCVIDDNGAILDSLGWWKEGSIRASVPQLNYVTFYSRHGDYIGRFGASIFVVYLLSLFVKWWINRSNRKSGTSVR